MTAYGTQGGQDCRFNLDWAQMLRREEQSLGDVRLFGVGDVRGRCIRPMGGRDTVTVWRMGSDSVAHYVRIGRADFVGSVWFRDSTVELTARRASYFEADDRVEAYGNVVLRNRETGSELTGPNLTYWRPLPGVRDAGELHATRRPVVEYRPAGDHTQEPYLIRAEQVRLRGDHQAWASGAVTIDRSDFSAQGDSTALDLNTGDGLLIGHAEARGTDSVSYDLTGHRIAFRLVNDQLSWVQAQGMADATSSEWRVVGDTIEFNLADDMIQSGIVWGDSVRPRAMSEKYTVSADSLEIDSPDQVLTEVRGFGTARATAKADSTAAEADWMAGDTLIVRFDSTANGSRTISELIAAGNAQAFYRIFDEADSTAAPALNYSRGLRIIARFKDEAVERVDVIGAADGVYLEPRRKPQE
ncbi:MAG: hypothetical protein JSW71_02530 [Gemmatimonadota bacterium]|nr:MAG: hypothetical protein JSW71_02530 [Gemmatimonadota bacterium]